MSAASGPARSPTPQLIMPPTFHSHPTLPHPLPSPTPITPPHFPPITSPPPAQLHCAESWRMLVKSKQIRLAGGIRGGPTLGLGGYLGRGRRTGRGEGWDGGGEGRRVGKTGGGRMGRRGGGGEGILGRVSRSGCWAERAWLLQARAAGVWVRSAGPALGRAPPLPGGRGRAVPVSPLLGPLSPPEGPTVSTLV